MIAALVFWLLSPVQAQVFVSEGSHVLSSTALQAMCRQMPGNHIEDLDSLERTYQELANSTDTGKISELVRQIKEISSRIRFLAKPEWNSENIPIEVTWEVPHTLFFDNSEYLDLKDAVYNAPLGRAPDLYRFFMARPGIITEKSLISAEYLNSENQDITKYITLKPGVWRLPYFVDRSFLIQLKKNVTALEACQFLKTILFEIKISYEETLLGMLVKSEKNIFLIYRNEAASAK